MNILLFLGVLTTLGFQSHHVLWQHHLQVDVVTYYYRTMHFLKQGSWASLGHNEYPPGALWFFVLVGWLTPKTSDFGHYLLGIMLTNGLLMAWHFGFFARHISQRSACTFSLILLAMGPILFFRFELVVTALVLFSWLLHSQGKQSQLAAFCLGMAASIKVYPVIFLPIMWIDLFRKKKSHYEWVETSIFFLVALLIPATTFVVLGGTWAEILNVLSVHRLKTLDVCPESVLVDATVFWNALVHKTFQFQSRPLVEGLLNWAWVVPTLIFYIIHGWKKASQASLIFGLMLGFVLFSKMMNPQYLWWAFSLLPLMSIEDRGLIQLLQKKVMLGLSVFALVLTQLIYPLYYTEFVAEFHANQLSTLFWISVFRNTLLVGVWVGSLIYCLKPQSAWPRRSAQ